MSPLVADIPHKPSQTLELFLIIDHLLKQTVNYAIQNAKYSFTFTSDAMKSFKGIMLVPGYYYVTHHRLDW